MSRGSVSNKDTYKVDLGSQKEPADTKSVSTNRNAFDQFVTIKVKPYDFKGRKAAALTIFKATEKIKNRLAKLEQRERHLNQQ